MMYLYSQNIEKDSQHPQKSQLPVLLGSRATLQFLPLIQWAPTISGVPDKF